MPTLTCPLPWGTILACAAATLNGQPNWHHRIVDNSDPSTPFESGEVYADFGFIDIDGGFVFRGVSSVESNDPNQISFIRFDDDGSPLWNARILTPDAEEPEIVSFSDSSKFWASSLDDAVGMARLGVYDATTLSPDFALQFPLPNGSDQTQLTRLLDNRIALTQFAEGKIDVVALEPTGDPVFQKRYLSDFFVQEDVQEAYLLPIRDGSGYTLTVDRSIQTSENPEVWRNEISTLFLDTSGAITAQNHIAYESPARAEASAFATTRSLLDGSIVYQFVEISDPEFVRKPNTYLIKIGPDGVVDFAKTLVAVQSPAPSEIDDSETHLYMVAGTNMALAGEFPSISLTSDTALLKISLADGSIVSSAILDAGDFEFGLTPVLVADSVFVPVSTAGSNPLAFDSINTVVKLPNDLSSASGVRLPESLSSQRAILSRHEESDTLIISLFKDGGIATITIAADLSTSCIESEAFTPTVDGSITAETLSFSSETPTVSTVDLATAFTPFTFMVSNFDFELTDLCDDTPPDDDEPTTSGDLSMRRSPDGFILSFPTKEGMVYEVRFSTDLSDFSLLEVVLGDGSVMGVSVSIPISARAFYTVVPATLQP